MIARSALVVMRSARRPDTAPVGATVAEGGRLPRRGSRASRELLARLTLALAAYAAVHAFATFEAHRLQAEETLYLARWGAVVLLAVAVLGVGRSRELVGGAVLFVAAVWFGGGGAPVAVTVGPVLGVALATAAWRHYQDVGVVGPALLVPVTLGVQTFLRPDLLLLPLLDLRTVVSLVAVPTAAALATVFLCRHHGVAAGVVASASAAILGPGWNVTTTLVLVSLAAGTVLGARVASVGPRLASLAVLAVPVVWEPWPGALLAGAGLLLALPGALARAAAGLAVASAALATTASVPEVLAAVSVALLVVPATVLFLVTGEREAQERAVLGGLLVGVVALAGVGTEALAAGAALAALGLRDGEAGSRLQAAWSGGLLTLVAVFAAYPWSRPEPLADAHAFLPLPPALGGVLVVLVLGGLVGGGTALARKRRRVARALPVVGVTLALAGAASAHLDVDRRAYPLEVPRALSAERPRWDVELTPGSERDSVAVSRIFVHSYLLHGADLVAGRPVAQLSLHDPQGAVLQSWTLRVGDDTAEWAASRPDVAGRPGFRAPPPWMSWVGTGGDVFARRFRAVRETSTPRWGARLTFQRLPSLPADVVLAVTRVEVKP